MSTLTPKTILYLNTSSCIGGAERSLLEILQFIDKFKIHPIIACPTEGVLPSRIREMGIDIHFSRFESLRNPVKFISEIRELQIFAQNNDVSLIHSNSTLSAKHAMFLGKILKVPTVAHIRDFVPATDLFFRIWLYFIDRVVAISKSVERSLRHPCIPNCTQLIYNGVDTERFVPSHDAAAIRRLLDLPSDNLLVGTIGRFGADKGMASFVDAAHLILQEFPHVRFVVVGDAVFSENIHYQDEAVQKIMDLHIKDHVLCMGNREDVHEIMAALDIIVVPSLREPFGRVAAEAGACGKPVVASAVGGLAEIVRDSETGILVPPDDPIAMSSAILRLLHSEELRRTMGIKARERICKLFDIRRTVNEIENLYSSLLNDDRITW